MATVNTSQRFEGPNWSFVVVLVFLIGLLFFSYPPLRVVSGGTRLFRPDWIFSLPLFGYFLIAKGQIRLTKPVLLSFLFVLVAGISFLVNPVRSPSGFLTLFTQLVFAVGLFTVLANMELDREMFIILLRMWVIILVVISVYAMYELVAINLNLPLSQLYDRRLKPNPVLANRYYRPVAMFSEPGFLSSFLATGIAVLLPPVATDKSLLFSKWTQRSLLVLLTGGVMVTVAFSGYLTLAVSLIIVVVLPPLRKPVIRFWVLIIILGAVGFVALSSVAPGAADSVLRRVDTAGKIFASLANGQFVAPSGSIGARWVRFLSGLKAAAANPLFGVGPGQFSHWIETAELGNLPPDPRYGRLHGGYIQVIAQTGIIGTVIFIALITGIIKELIHRSATSQGDNHTLALVCTCMIIFMLVGWTHSFGMIHPIRWGMIGLCYGYVSTGG